MISKCTSRTNTGFLRHFKMCTFFVYNGGLWKQKLFEGRRRLRGEEGVTSESWWAKASKARPAHNQNLCHFIYQKEMCADSPLIVNKTCLLPSARQQPETFRMMMRKRALSTQRLRFM